MSLKAFQQIFKCLVEESTAALPALAGLKGAALNIHAHGIYCQGPGCMEESAVWRSPTDNPLQTQDFLHDAIKDLLLIDWMYLPDILVLEGCCGAFPYQPPVRTVGVC